MMLNKITTVTVFNADLFEVFVFYMIYNVSVLLTDLVFSNSLELCSVLLNVIHHIISVVVV